uniref:Ras-related protein Rab-26 n=1 Tax=Anthurium amnicola TaxID=1678845 RepID=A0A1D1XF97_9ARAE
MTQLQRALVRLGLKRTLTGHLTLFRRLLRFLRDRVLACSAGSPRRYRRLGRCPSATHEAAAALPGELAVEAAATIPGCSDGHDGDSDLVALKISLLGDCHIGKTTFMVRNRGIAGPQKKKKTLPFIVFQAHIKQKYSFRFLSPLFFHLLAC